MTELTQKVTATTGLVEEVQHSLNQMNDNIIQIKTELQDAKNKKKDEPPKKNEQLQEALKRIEQTLKKLDENTLPALSASVGTLQTAIGETGVIGKPLKETKQAVADLKEDIGRKKDDKPLAERMKALEGKFQSLDDKKLEALIQLPTQFNRIETDVVKIRETLLLEREGVKDAVVAIRSKVNALATPTDSGSGQVAKIVELLQTESARIDVAVILSNGAGCDAKIAAIVGEKALASNLAGLRNKNFRLAVLAESDGKLLYRLLDWPVSGKQSVYQRNELPDPTDSNLAKIKQSDVFPTKKDGEVIPPKKDGELIARRVVFVTGPTYAPPADNAAKEWAGVMVDAILLVREKEDSKGQQEKNVVKWAGFCRDRGGAALIITIPDDFSKLAAEKPKDFLAHPSAKLLATYLRRLTAPTDLGDVPP